MKLCSCWDREKTMQWGGWGTPSPFWRKVCVHRWRGRVFLSVDQWTWPEQRQWMEILWVEEGEERDVFEFVGSGQILEALEGQLKEFIFIKCSGELWGFLLGEWFKVVSVQNDLKCLGWGWEEFGTRSPIRGQPLWARCYAETWTSWSLGQN